MMEVVVSEFVTFVVSTYWSNANKVNGLVVGTEVLHTQSVRNERKKRHTA